MPPQTSRFTGKLAPVAGELLGSELEGWSRGASALRLVTRGHRSPAGASGHVTAAL